MNAHGVCHRILRAKPPIFKNPLESGICNVLDLQAQFFRFPVPGGSFLVRRGQCNPGCNPNFSPEYSSSKRVRRQCQAVYAAFCNSECHANVARFAHRIPASVHQRRQNHLPPLMRRETMARETIFTDQELTEALALGRTPSQIAEQFHVSRAAVSKRLEAAAPGDGDQQVLYLGDHIMAPYHRSATWNL